MANEYEKLIDGTDPELRAIKQLLEELARLEPDARRRVIRYLLARLKSEEIEQ